MTEENTIITLRLKNNSNKEKKAYLFGSIYQDEWAEKGYNKDIEIRCDEMHYKSLLNLLMINPCLSVGLSAVSTGSKEFLNNQIYHVYRELTETRTEKNNLSLYSLEGHNKAVCCNLKYELNAKNYLHFNIEPNTGVILCFKIMEVYQPENIYSHRKDVHLVGKKMMKHEPTGEVCEYIMPYRSKYCD